MGYFYNALQPIHYKHVNDMPSCGQHVPVYSPDDPALRRVCDCTRPGFLSTIQYKSPVTEWS